MTNQTTGEAAPSAADADALALATARKMLSGDRVARRLGIELVAAAAGRATLAMTVADDMANGFGSCHGGVLFTLADTALSCACNAHDVRSVAHHCSIVYLRPARLGARLFATVVERSRAGRVGLYDVAVRDERGEAIAEFFGHARLIGGPVLDAAADGAPPRRPLDK